MQISLGQYFGLKNNLSKSKFLPLFNKETEKETSDFICWTICLGNRELEGVPETPVFHSESGIQKFKC